ncbi:MAG: hypothetical protein VKP70_12230 [Cyanobacteriota bacterium]|nr:hypothetical protein [Cyanobacteriota bacterium]
MKRGIPLKGRGAPLVVACLAALTVHALGLALLHGRRTGPERPAAFATRDNSPELLQWSSQPAPLPNLEVLPLPKSAVLPPPPDRLPALRRPSGAGGPPQQRSGRRAKGPGGPPGPARSGRGRQGRQGASAPPSGPQAAGFKEGGDSAEDWSLALEQLAAVARRETPRADEGDDRPPGRLALEPSAREAYQALWSQGRPYRVPLAALEPTGAVAARQVSLGQIRAAALPIRHGEAIVLPGEVLLVWLQGERVLLLRSTSSSAPGR